MTTPANIPLARPWFGEEEFAAVKRVLESGWVVQGPEVAAFEHAVAELHQMPHAIAVSSATAGLHLTYLALGLGPGDGVLIPSFAWPSAANMAVRVGAVPFFVDVDPLTANMTGATLERGLAEIRQRGLAKPRGVVVVHEFGRPAPMGEVLHIADAEDLLVIEDAACALGARHEGKPLGHFGRATVFSFHPRKSVSTGEGGVVVTREPEVAAKLRSLRNHGQEMADGQRDFTTAGFNYRLTELQAAVGSEQLKRLPGILETRKRLVSRYLSELKGLAGLTLPADDPEHTWQTFMVTVDSPSRREHVQEVCTSRGIETGPGTVAGHQGAVWDRRFLEPEDVCPVSTRLAQCGMALPLHARLTEEDLGRVAVAVRSALLS